nr:MAG TPA: hypothetical protein [Caudoviricetes sp.]
MVEFYIFIIMKHTEEILGMWDFRWQWLCKDN